MAVKIALLHLFFPDATRLNYRCVFRIHRATVPATAQTRPLPEGVLSAFQLFSVFPAHCSSDLLTSNLQFTCQAFPFFKFPVTQFAFSAYQLFRFQLSRQLSSRDKKTTSIQIGDAFTDDLPTPSLYRHQRLAS